MSLVGLDVDDPLVWASLNAKRRTQQRMPAAQHQKHTNIVHICGRKENASTNEPRKHKQPNARLSRLLKQIERSSDVDVDKVLHRVRGNVRLVQRGRVHNCVYASVYHCVFWKEGGGCTRR